MKAFGIVGICFFAIKMIAQIIAYCDTDGDCKVGVISNLMGIALSICLVILA